jgi:hypothetical protein
MNGSNAKGANGDGANGNGANDNGANGNSNSVGNGSNGNGLGNGNGVNTGGEHWRTEHRRPVWGISRNLVGSAVASGRVSVQSKSPAGVALPPPMAVVGSNLQQKQILCSSAHTKKPQRAAHTQRNSRGHGARGGAAHILTTDIAFRGSPRECGPGNRREDSSRRGTAAPQGRGGVEPATEANTVQRCTHKETAAHTVHAVGQRAYYNGHGV